MSRRAPAAPPLLEAQLANARVWCTGVVQGNLGDHVGDDPVAVARNRAALAGPTGTDPSNWVWVSQVHGAVVHEATALTPAGHATPVADAIVTGVPGLALAIVTADCAPLVLASDDAVGVVHAGYRGIASGVIEATIERLREIGTGEVRAFLGPCIRAPRYEFGADDLAPFVDAFGAQVEGRTRTGRPALDIPAAIRVVLDRSGVVAFDDCGVCTADSSDYFSYRRDGQTGRQATIAVLVSTDRAASDRAAQ